MNIPTKIVTHTAVSAKHHTAQDVNNWHRDRWNGYSPSRRPEAPYAGYHYIIEWDGNTVQCRDHDEEGIHCRGQNFSSIGVCFMGNGDLHYPSKEQEEAWSYLYETLIAEMPEVRATYPHRKYSPKSCHGRLLSNTYFADIVDRQQKMSYIEELKALINKLQSLLLLRRMK